MARHDSLRVAAVCGSVILAGTVIWYRVEAQTPTPSTTPASQPALILSGSKSSLIAAPEVKGEPNGPAPAPPQMIMLGSKSAGVVGPPIDQTKPAPATTKAATTPGSTKP